MTVRSKRAVITGLGAVSGFGLGVPRLWSALLQGRRAVATHQVGATLGTMALVPDSLLGERAAALTRMAAEEAVCDAGGVTPGARLAVSVGTTLGGISAWLAHLRDRAAASEHWTWSGPAETIAAAHGAEIVSVASIACASANAALGTALELIRTSRADQVIAGGVDALNDFVVAGFASLKALDPDPCRPFDRARRGLNLGEGAGFLVLEEESHARARGARIRALLSGYGSATDANHMTGPDRQGRGAAHAMQAALEDAAVFPAAIDFVSTHGTATPFNDAMEARALHAVFGARAARLPAHSIKGSLGHTLGAAGALEALVCVRILETGHIPPTVGLMDRDPEIELDLVAGAARACPVTTALSTSSGFGGLNAAVVLQRFEAA